MLIAKNKRAGIAACISATTLLCSGCSDFPASVNAFNAAVPGTPLSQGTAVQASATPCLHPGPFTQLDQNTAATMNRLAASPAGLASRQVQLSAALSNLQVSLSCQ
jgi:hypothetical protein